MEEKNLNSNKILAEFNKERLPEIDVLRIIAILIVVILIHLPHDYIYNFYLDLTYRDGYFLNILGVYCSVGSFVFLSGFSLHLQNHNRHINSVRKLAFFLKKRFIRIFPLYWFALVIFLIMFNQSYGLNVSAFELIAHIFGFQIIFAPIIGQPPLLTLWFVGLIVIYYSIYPIFSYLNSSKKILVASLIIFGFFLVLNSVFGLIEYRFFFYYFIFVTGVITANLNKNTDKIFIKKELGLVIGILTVLISYLLYTVLAVGFYSNSIFTSQIIWELLDPRFYSFNESMSAIIILNIIIMSFIVFIISISNLGVRLVKKNSLIIQGLSILAYSTFCVYLFHRPIIVVLSGVLTFIFSLDMYARSNLYLIFPMVTVIFIVSFLIQKFADSIISRINNKFIYRITEVISLFKEPRRTSD